MKGDRERCLEAGMDGYVSKPIDVGELARAIEAIFPSEVADLGLPGGSPSSGPLSEPVGDIDWNAAAARIPGGTEGLRDTALLLLEECPRLLGEIEAARLQNDGESLQRAAHTLKGAADLFGATGVMTAAARLEQLGHNGELSAAPQHVAQLEEELDRLQAAIRSGIDSLTS